MDKTDKPKSVREVLEDFGRGSEPSECSYCPSTSKDCEKCPKMIKSLTDIYSLLAEGVEDKECSCGETTRNTWGCECGAEAFNQANALWRKHLQERLR